MTLFQVYSSSLLKFSEESWLCHTRIFVHIYGTPLKSQDSHGDLSKNKLKPNTVQSFSISAWPKWPKPTARANPPGLVMLGIANHYPSKQPECPALAGSQAERKQGRTLLSTSSSHPQLGEWGGLSFLVGKLGTSCQATLSAAQQWKRVPSWTPSAISLLLQSKL